MSFLQISQLTKRFGSLTAVDHLDLTVERGQIVSMIGPNGSGKTTVFNLVTGLYSPDSGEITLAGESLVGKLPHEITARGVARTFQTLRLFANMSILENVMVGQHARSCCGMVEAILRLPAFGREEKRIRERAEGALSFFGSRLAGYRLDQPAYCLSYANRRRLEIARAIATDPLILLLDEPAAGMNPRETLEMADMIRRLRDEWGYTLLVVEHDMTMVQRISDHVIVLDHGCKIAEGTYADVICHDQVVEAYLGRRHMDACPATA